VFVLGACKCGTTAHATPTFPPTANNNVAKEKEIFFSGYWLGKV